MIIVSEATSVTAEAVKGNCGPGRK